MLGKYISHSEDSVTASVFTHLLEERRTAKISAAVTVQIDERDPSLNVREPGGSVPA